MVSSRFEGILKDMESFFQCELKPDANDSCLIKLKSGISVQIELNPQELLIIGCRVGVLQMGRFREQVIQEALKSNDMSTPSTGSFGYSHRSQNLILFLLIDPKELSMNQIPTILEPFITKAQLWADSLARGETPPVIADSSRPLGIFGIRP